MPLLPPGTLPQLARVLPLITVFGCVSLPVHSQPIPLGCEDVRDGAQARAVAIYARVLAEPVCLLDSRGRCHMRYAPGAVVIHPVAWSAAPSPATLTAGLQRRGIDVGIVTPRGARRFASHSTSEGATFTASEPALVLQLGEIELTADGSAAVVAVHTVGGSDVPDPTRPHDRAVYRLMRIEGASGGSPAVPRRLLSPVNACWQLDVRRRSMLTE